MFCELTVSQRTSYFLTKNRESECCSLNFCALEQLNLCQIFANLVQSSSARGFLVCSVFRKFSVNFSVFWWFGRCFQVKLFFYPIGVCACYSKHLGLPINYSLRINLTLVVSKSVWNCNKKCGDKYAIGTAAKLARSRPNRECIGTIIKPVIMINETNADVADLQKLEFWRKILFWTFRTLFSSNQDTLTSSQYPKDGW